MNHNEYKIPKKESYAQLFRCHVKSSCDEKDEWGGWLRGFFLTTSEMSKVGAFLLGCFVRLVSLAGMYGGAGDWESVGTYPVLVMFWEAGGNFGG